MEDFSSRFFRGQGKVFFCDRDVDGNPVNCIFVGNVSSAELTSNIERGEKIESVSGKSGLGSSFIKRSQYNISLALSSVKPDHLAESLHATSSAKTANSVTDEAYTAKLGRMSPLQYLQVSNVVVTGSGGTPTYVANTDYKVHAKEGVIEWLTGGTITDDTAVLIDYDHSAQHHITVEPHNLEKYIFFAGMNSADNDKQARVELYKTKLDPGVVSMITDDAVDIPLNGTLELDTDRAPGDQFYSWKTED